MEWPKVKDLLLEEYTLRKANNSQYSLNKFSSDAGVSPAQMNGVLNDKRGLSPASAIKIGTRLKWGPNRSSLLCLLVSYHYGRSQTEKLEAQIELNKWYEKQSVRDNGLHGMWFATKRIGASGSAPNFWNPTTDQQFFTFKSDGQYQHFVQSKGFTSCCWGEFKLLNNLLATTQMESHTFGKCPWIDYNPRIAPTHVFQWLDENTFQLSSKPESLTPKTLNINDRLVTVWERAQSN